MELEWLRESGGVGTGELGLAQLAASLAELKRALHPAGAASVDGDAAPTVHALRGRLEEVTGLDRATHARLTASVDDVIAELSAAIGGLEAHSRVSMSVEPAVETPPQEAIQPKLAPEADAQPAALGPGHDVESFVTTIQQRIGLLSDLMHSRDSVLEPVLNANAEQGHAYERCEELLGIGPGESTRVLEELADLGLLQRELCNRVHLCPQCHRCQLNFRELCPSCSSIDLEVEAMVHHFRCGYSGLESEFSAGFDLSCPKCQGQLFQLGQDFDRPHETHKCRKCQYLFEEPMLEGQCLCCGNEFHASEVVQSRVHRYRPTPLTVRAVELGRLTGLEVDSILYDSSLQIATRDFLDFEVKRELIRLGRYTTAFSTATLHLERRGWAFPIFREWHAGAVRELCTLLAKSLRSLDLVTRLDEARVGILLPEADSDGAHVVRDRLFGLLEDLQFLDSGGHALVPCWTMRTWSEKGTEFADVRTFFDAEESSA